MVDSIVKVYIDRIKDIYKQFDSGYPEVDAILTLVYIIQEKD